MELNYKHLDSLASDIADVFARLEKGWRGYEKYPVPAEDFAVAVAGLVDYISGIEGESVGIELPNADIKLSREDGDLSVWVKVGDVEFIDE